MTNKNFFHLADVAKVLHALAEGDARRAILIEEVTPNSPPRKKSTWTGDFGCGADWWKDRVNARYLGFALESTAKKCAEQLGHGGHAMHSSLEMLNVCKMFTFSQLVFLKSSDPTPLAMRSN